MSQAKTYKVIIPYSESATPRKKFKIEYTVEASDRITALKKQSANSSLMQTTTAPPGAQ